MTTEGPMLSSETARGPRNEKEGAETNITVMCGTTETQQGRTIPQPAAKRYEHSACIVRGNGVSIQLVNQAICFHLG